MTDWDVVGRANYVSFTSYRKDGTAVSSPVWIAPADGKLYFFSEVGAYKVKRVRRNPAVTLQPCDVRGKLTADSPWSTAPPVFSNSPTARESARS